MHFGVSKPASDRRIAELDRAAAAGDAREAELGRRVDEQKARISQLEKSLADMQTELSARSAIPGAPAKLPTGATGATGAKGGRTGTSGDSKGKGLNDGPPCPKFDPLCFHIDTH
jgi:hypothetical protein